MCSYTRTVNHQPNSIDSRLMSLLLDREGNHIKLYEIVRVIEVSLSWLTNGDDIFIIDVSKRNGKSSFIIRKNPNLGFKAVSYLITK